MGEIDGDDLVMSVDDLKLTLAVLPWDVPVKFDQSVENLLINDYGEKDKPFTPNEAAVKLQFWRPNGGSAFNPTIYLNSAHNVEVIEPSHHIVEGSEEGIFTTIGETIEDVRDVTPPSIVPGGDYILRVGDYTGEIESMKIELLTVTLGYSFEFEIDDTQEIVIRVGEYFNEEDIGEYVFIRDSTK